MANPNYFDDFNYIPVYQKVDEGTRVEDELNEMQKARGEFIIDNDNVEGNDDWVSDKVRVGLNLAFVHENVAREFKFAKKIENSNVKAALDVMSDIFTGGKTNNIL